VATNSRCRAKENENNAIMAHCKPAPNSFTRGVGQISRRLFAANRASKLTSDAAARFSARENYRGEKRKARNSPKWLHLRFEKSRANERR
jgi:hypothetical protein